MFLMSEEIFFFYYITSFVEKIESLFRWTGESHSSGLLSIHYLQSLFVQWNIMSLSRLNNWQGGNPLTFVQMISQQKWVNYRSP